MIVGFVMILYMGKPALVVFVSAVCGVCERERGVVCIYCTSAHILCKLC